MITNLLTLCLVPGTPPIPAGDADISIFAARVEAGDVETSAGANIQLEYRASNAGSVDLEDVTIGYYLSVDTVFDGGDVAMEFEDISVDVGDIEDESEQVTVPAATTPGCYYVLVVADPSGNLAETDVSNNVDSARIAVDVSLVSCGDPLPDLVPRAPGIDADHVQAGSATRVTVTSANEGDESAGDVEMFYYLSADAAYDPGVDTFLGFDEATLLLPGDSELETESVTIPASTPPGRYQVLFFVDGGDDIVESDETNNLAAQPLTVLAPSVSLYGEDLGQPHVGTLLTLDTPTAGVPLRLEVSDFPLASFAIAWASFDQGTYTRFGGTLLANPYAPELWVPFSVSGDPQSVTVDLPASMGGTTLYAQAMARDATQVQGVAFTNGLAIVLP